MGGTEQDKRLVELLDMERLQALQDNLAKALDLAFVTVDYRGSQVTKGSGYTQFCSCMRSHEKFGPLCSQCSAHGGFQAAIGGKPFLYRCHAGLAKFAVPILVNGKHIGAIMGGQVELQEETSDLQPVLPQKTHWEGDPELVKLRGNVHKSTYEKLEAGANLVQDIIRNMLEEKSCRLAQEELSRKNRELLEEKTARASLELAAAEENQQTSVPEVLDKEHLFYVLNVISCLAFREKAEETERTACDFAAMMRYALENGDYNFVTVGEELEYISYYLQIQRRRLEGRLHYEIRVPEKYHSTLCPFLLLHPLIKNLLMYMADNSREGGSLIVRGREEKGLLVLEIDCTCTGLNGQQAGEMLDLDGKRQGKSLQRIDQSLKRVFGSRCGVSAKIREEDHSGTEIQIRLPLHGRKMEK